MEKIKNLKKKIIEDQFFRPKWYSIFLNPYFINRYSLFKEINNYAKNASESGKLLDIGCGLKPYRNLFKTKEYIGIDIQGGGHIDEAKNVDKIFIEYHSILGEKQTVNEILSVLTENNFRYYIENTGINSKHPFVSINSNLNYDLQLNIFANKYE